MSAVRGVRGATTVRENDRAEILAATRELLEQIVRLNDVQPEDVASVWFTVTADLDAEFPAFAAREIGWHDVPLICGREIPVPGALGRCIRVLVHWNTDRRQGEIRHAFLHDARALRPHWAVDLPGDPPLDARAVERATRGYEQEGASADPALPVRASPPAIERSEAARRADAKRGGPSAREGAR